MKIAIDIDSTLHHYWDDFADAARRRFGVELPYEQQVTWADRPAPARAGPRLHRGDPLARTASGAPSPTPAPSRSSGAGTRPGTSSTSPATARSRPTATRRAGWSEIGLPYDELYCSYDKVTRAREIGIDVLIDDSPVNLMAALDAGISPRRSSIPGTGTSSRRRTSSPPTTGPAWKPRCSRSSSGPAPGSFTGCAQHPSSPSSRSWRC